MGKPAARMGDTTAHGGTIAVGNPMIMIGKMPASALGDMLYAPCARDRSRMWAAHHSGSMGVLVGKKPAARLSD